MDPVELAVDLLKVVISLIGLEQTKQTLDRVAVEMANLAADELEDAKFGKEPQK